MNSSMGLFAIAAAVAFVGALWVGVPLAGLVPLMFVLVCPLMMIFMMKGMHGDGGHEQGDADQRSDQTKHH